MSKIVVLGLIFGLFGSFGAGVTIYATFFQDEKADALIDGGIEIQVDSEIAIVLTPYFDGRLVAVCNGGQLTHGSIIDATLVNTSQSNLGKADFEEPITLTVTDATILCFEVIEKRPLNLGINITKRGVDTLEFSKAAILGLGREYLKFRFLTDGPSPTLLVGGRTTVPGPELIGLQYEQMRDDKLIIPLMIPLVVTVIGWGLVIITLFVGMYRAGILRRQ